MTPHTDTPTALVVHPAGIWRRGLAAALDAAVIFFLVFLLFVLNILDRHLITLPGDWYWSEWLLHQAAYSLSDYVVLLVVYFALFIAWQTAWLATIARTPGGWLLGVLTVDRHGDSITASRALLRAAGSLLNLASLGLGYLWIIASPAKRGWHDIAAGTWVIVPGRTYLDYS